MVIKNEIIYPIFLECLKYCTDIFWENIFEDLVYGKTPYGTYISKDFICCSYKGKEFSYKIERSKDPKIIYDELYDLLFYKLGLLSTKDKIKKKVDFYNFEKDIKDSRNKNWNSIRKKNIKDLYIENYVLNMKKKYNLTLKQAKHLLSMISIGMIFKVISCKDIEYEDGNIINIKGIKFLNKKIIIEKNIYDLENNYTCILIDKPLLSNEWEKYLKKMEIIESSMS